MNTIAQDAAASIHPNALTSRESSVVRKAMEIIESKRLKNADVLYYMEDFERYLMMRFSGLVHEQGHAVYLDTGRRLIDADTLAFGNQKQVTWDIRHLAFRAMALGAEYVVMAHNHPNDCPTPSDADVNNLTAFERGLSMVGISLLDSFVVTSKQVTSIKNYRKRMEEMESRERSERWERERLERQAKREANRAAKLAAKLEGAAA
jgi:DNA repair protein RadC